MALFFSTPHTLRSTSLYLSSMSSSKRTTISNTSGGAFQSSRNKFLSTGTVFKFGGVLGYGSHGGMFLGKEWMGRRPRIRCASSVLSPYGLQWISAVSTIVLMLSKGTAIQKSFLPPLFALQAPIEIVSWIKGEYGAWTAFLALLVRLFYYIPSDLDLPFVAMLLVMVAPYQSMMLRGAPSGAIISCAISVYLAYQHFSKAGSFQRALSEGAIFATLAIVLLLAVSFSLLL